MQMQFGLRTEGLLTSGPASGPGVAFPLCNNQSVPGQRDTSIDGSYMQKTCDVAEKAILAKKNCGKSA